MKIQVEMRCLVAYTEILDARRDLIATGDLPLDAKPSVRHSFRCRAPKGAPRGGLTGETADELAAIERSTAAIRAELATRLPDDPRPVTGKLLLDQVCSPGLDRLSPAKVSAILRRRCRPMFRRQATAGGEGVTPGTAGPL